MSNEVLIAIIALGGPVVGGLISSRITYLVQKMQLERESQARFQEWLLGEYSGRTSAIKDALGAAMKLYGALQFPDPTISFESLREELFKKLQDGDYWLIASFHPDLGDSCAEFAKCADKLRTINDLKEPLAKEIIEQLRDAAMDAVKKLDSFKQRIRSNS